MFQFLTQPILNILIVLYNLLFSNLGLAIIALTTLFKLILYPLTAPQLKASQKLQEINPELEKLKRKYKDDKQKLMQAQMELYKKHGFNPASGCLPQILQLVILISLYQVFSQVIRPGAETLAYVSRNLYRFVPVPSSLNLNFLFLNLAKPDLITLPGLAFPLPGIFVLLAAALQFLTSFLMMPTIEKESKVAKKTEEKSDDLSVSMQKQMLYLFPIMTLIFGYTLPSGVILYWFVFSLIGLLQQILISKKLPFGKFGSKKGMLIHE